MHGGFKVDVLGAKGRCKLSLGNDFAWEGRQTKQLSLIDKLHVGMKSFWTEMQGRLYCCRGRRDPAFLE